MITDTERLDFIEKQCCRAAEVQDENDQVKRLMRVWALGSQRDDDTLRQTIDAMMKQAPAPSRDVVQ